MTFSPRAALSVSVTAAAVLVATPLFVDSAMAADRKRPSPVTTDNETPVLYDDEGGGNASGDDPAIWVHPDDSGQSIVIVTAKDGGLRVYDLSSRELQIPSGERGATG